MVRQIHFQPESFEGRFPNHEWWELHDVRGVYGVAATHARAGELMLHLTLTRPMTPSLFCLLRKDMEFMDNYCRNHGLDRVVGVADEDNVLFCRFCVLMGFTEPRTIQVAYKEVM